MIHGVLVTYERPELLREMCARLAEQTRPLDSLVIVDNSRQPLSSAEVRTAGASAYIHVGENLGPAGGISRGMDAVLEFASDDDWVLLLDDDNPPASNDLLESLTDFAERMRLASPNLGGVGLVGARFDRRLGRVVRYRDVELEGPLPVDCIGGNQLPLYAVSMIRAVGTFDRELFFGFEELEYGLRVRSARFELFADGALLRQQRQLWGRLGFHEGSAVPSLPAWREYYSRRNLIWILRRNGCRRALLRQTLLVGVRSMAGLLGVRGAGRQQARLLARAIVDGWSGRLGRTVEPVSKY